MTATPPATPATPATPPTPATAPATLAAYATAPAPGPGRQRRGPRRVLPDDPMLRNSVLGLLATLLMAGSGALFWVLVARLRPAADVGLAGTLVTAGEALAVLALLGYNVAVVRTMPRSSRPAADILTPTVKVVGAAVVLAGAYAAALPLIAPPVAEVVLRWWAAPLFVLLVAATAVNQLSDALFLAVDRVATNVAVNGLLMSAVKLTLPFALATAGAIGIYASMGLAALVAGSLSIVLILRRLPPGPRWGVSPQLREARAFGRAGYLQETLYLAPQLAFPLIVVAGLGAAANARYFVAFQIVMLLNALVYVVAHSMYADASRRPHEARAVVRRGGLTVLAGAATGCVLLVLLAPLLLLVFGPEYARESTTTLRILAVAALAVGVDYWAAMRLRIAGHRRSMVAVQAVTTAAMLAGAVLLVDRGIEWVAGVWLVGHLLGAAAGLALSFTVARLHDTEPGTDAS